MKNYKNMALNKYIEHTILTPDLSESKIISNLQEVIKLKIFGICLPLAYVSLAKKELAKTNLKIITVIDFPTGSNTPKEKALEAKAAKIFGADELDLVIDYNAIINKNYQLALDGILAVKKAAKNLI